jgi:aspartate aminotransferase
MFLLGLERKKQFPDKPLFDLSLGNPDLEPPGEVVQAIQKVATDASPGMHRYMDNAGFFATRQFVAQELTLEFGVPIHSEQVFLTAGAAGGLQIMMRALLDPEDEVLVFAPYFSEYAPYSHNFGARLKVCTTDENHLPNWQHFDKLLSEKTKLVILNSPNNPCGVAWGHAELDTLSKRLFDFRIKDGRIVHIVSDEPYAKLIFSNTPALPKVLCSYDATWLVRSHSKDLGLAGDRIGYLVWSPSLHSSELLGSLRSSARSLGQVNASAFFQRLLPLVANAKVNVEEYQQRVEMFLSEFQKVGVSCATPAGGFFLFPKSPLAAEEPFVQQLLEEGVLVVAGKGFGKPGYVRLSLTRPRAELEQALRIFVNVYKRFT